MPACIGTTGAPIFGPDGGTDDELVTRVEGSDDPGGKGGVDRSVDIGVDCEVVSDIGPDKDIPHVSAAVIVKYISDLELLGLL